MKNEKGLCPFCGSDDSDIDSGSGDDQYMHDRLICNECGGKFSITYKALAVSRGWDIDFRDEGKFVRDIYKPDDFNEKLEGVAKLYRGASDLELYLSGKILEILEAVRELRNDTRE